MEEELKQARYALNLARLQLARYGINAPPHMIMEAEDLERRVAQLQAAVGQPVTEPRELPPAPPRHRVVYDEPAPRFAERMRAREVGERQRDAEHQVSLLAIHRRNLALLRTQQRQLGAHAPFYIQSQIMDAQASIAGIKDALRSFYGMAVDDLPGDR